jgi:hypothetical protein
VLPKLGGKSILLGSEPVPLGSELVPLGSELGDLLLVVRLDFGCTDEIVARARAAKSAALLCGRYA